MVYTLLALGTERYLATAKDIVLSRNPSQTTDSRSKPEQSRIILFVKNTNLFCLAARYLGIDQVDNLPILEHVVAPRRLRDIGSACHADAHGPDERTPVGIVGLNP